MRVLGIESSCDETGVALYDTEQGLIAHALHSQIPLHQAFGGVVPELASRDHIRRLVPLLREVLRQSDTQLQTIDAIAYTKGPGLAGALLVGASFAEALAAVVGCPTLPVHHLEGHLLSPLLSARPPAFPFVALLVSGGHSQLMRVGGVGDYELLGETLDDAAGEAFDKTAKLLGLPYPGGPELAKMAGAGRSGIVGLPRPMLNSGDFSFSFSGLKTAVLTRVREFEAANALDEQARADIACAFQEAVVEVLVKKSFAAIKKTGLSRLVVAGGVGANLALREKLNAEGARRKIDIYYPEFEFCTDNGAMIALAGALRLQAGIVKPSETRGSFAVRPRWPLAELMRTDAQG